METIIFILKSFVLGIIEGLTEFLPVSSTGHLIIFQNILNFENETNKDYVEMYTYVIQLGAILAVVILYWKKIKETLINFFPQKVGYVKSGFRFWLMIVIACIPGGILGILFDNIVDKLLIIAITLFVGGILMIYAEIKLKSNNPDTNIHVTIKQAIIIGLFQCLAIIPGMSRSASTIIGGWVSGLSTVASAEFSFFLAIPVMVGMSFLKIIRFEGTLDSTQLLSLAVGFLVSFIVALIVIKKFINYLKNKSMKIFAIYRMILAVIILLAGVFRLVDLY
ncbi:MAG: undecaprenyl-diphosphatase [Haloplasmataceae bacterium]|jgi:undecaprenyl-diphosphatase|nr:undecaprenyl-diphosphatase [Haloplasmataceae bacterium]